jgi:hypothetical protein
VADHGDESGASQLAGELHAAEDVVVEDIAGDAGVEDVAQALIEHQLGGTARIKTAQHDRKRVLSSGGRLTFRGEVAVNRAAGDESLVALSRSRACAGVVAACEALVGGVVAAGLFD